MRIKIIGDNNCARATRHLLRLAGFAVTEFLPANAVTGGPLAGYAITIDLAPAPHTPESLLRPDPPTHHPHASASEEAPRLHRDASSPAFILQSEGRTTAGKPTFGDGSEVAQNISHFVIPSEAKNLSGGEAERESDSSAKNAPRDDSSSKVQATDPGSARIHFDSVDSALEAAVLRHVTQLAAGPVIVDRPGGVVHSDRELRIVAPNTGDGKADEAAAVAIEFGVLRGLLDLTTPGVHKKTWGAYAGKSLLNGDGGDESIFAKGSADQSATGSVNSRSVGGKRWWPFGILLIAGGVGLLRADIAAARARFREDLVKSHRLKPALLGAEPQGQFATGEGFKITDGTNFLVVDPCKGQTKLYASINQTGNTQLAAGTASKKIYVCSVHVVAAAATNIAVVEGTGSVCGTSTTGVSGFGGATAATGWNFAANGGIALGNGDSSLGAEGTSGDNLCIFNSGSGQVSGGISYVVQ